MAEDEIDWTPFAGVDNHSVISRIEGPTAPEAAIVGYVCKGCGKPHVIINLATGGVQMALAFDPIMARSIAFALIGAADRIAPQGRH